MNKPNRIQTYHKEQKSIDNYRIPLTTLQETYHIQFDHFYEAISMRPSPPTLIFFQYNLSESSVYEEYVFDV